MLNNFLEFAGFVSLICGVFLLAGAAWALVAAGVLVVGYVEISDWSAARSRVER